MADRFFPNDMPSFVPETDDPSAAGVASSSPLLKLLSLPYSKTAERFLRAALDLKEKVVKETWVRAGRRVKDSSLYTGALGTAFLLLKSYQVTGDRGDLTLCNEIVRACDSASQGSKYVTFICGRAGVCALGAVAAKHTGDESLLSHYLKSFQEINLPPGVPNELLYGRAGYLWACSFLNKNMGDGTIPSTHMIKIAKEIITDGRKLSNKGSCPLMYEWHGTKYWGAAHGLAGIMHVLMDMDLKPEERDFVKGTLAYMIQNRFRSGNYPSSEGKDTDRLVHWCHGAPGLALTLNKADRLVHWCHGAPGLALTLNKAALVFKDEQFLHAAVEAAEVVWNRGLLKRVGICHGVSGNALVFLSLYRSTGNIEYLYRAKAFTCFLLDKANQLIADGKMHSGDRPYSLFEGQAGMAYLFLNMVKPSESLFPAYEL